MSVAVIVVVEVTGWQDFEAGQVVVVKVTTSVVVVVEGRVSVVEVRVVEVGVVEVGVVEEADGLEVEELVLSDVEDVEDVVLVAGGQLVQR
jgi:hypothetical protein